jgi:uncharacterized membrane protein YheB (UPF0754 family)
MNINAILAWVIPPVVGAVIGFLTNVLAIKMLFRPLAPVRIGRFRLPLTPGVLPRERARLADSIGSMVERELLTPEILTERLSKDDVHSFIRSGVGHLIDTLLENKFNAAGELTLFLVPIQKELPGILRKKYPDIKKTITEFLNKPEIKDMLIKWGHAFLLKTITQLSATQRFFMALGNFEETLTQKMPQIVDGFILSVDELLSDEKTSEKIIGFMSDKLISIMQNDNGSSIESIIPISDEFKSQAINAISGKLITLMLTMIPTALTAIDIKQMVSDRINALPMERVERIVLDVMANELKWIDLFGALLGFLIGLFQAFLSSVLY